MNAVDSSVDAHNVNFLTTQTLQVIKNQPNPLARLFTRVAGHAMLCPACAQPERGGGICSTCATFLSAIQNPCPMCSRPDCGEVCGLCLQKPPPWDNAYVQWHFTGLVRHLIHQFKYHHDMAAAEALFQQWSLTLPTQPDTAILAVPMYAKKEAKRGYNQATVLAKKLSKHAQLPLWKGVKRTSDTPPLEGLSKKERQVVLKNAFAVTQKPPQAVVIVDDVFTSGSTAAELSRLLKKHGTQLVTVCALARTPLG